MKACHDAATRRKRPFNAKLWWAPQVATTKSQELLFFLLVAMGRVPCWLIAPFCVGASFFLLFLRATKIAGIYRTVPVQYRTVTGYGTYVEVLLELDYYFTYSVSNDGAVLDSSCG